MNPHGSIVDGLEEGNFQKINFASLYLTTIPEDANSSSGAAVGSSICAMTTKPRSQLLQETIPITKKQNGSTTSSVLGHMGGLVDDTADPDENNDEEVMGSFRRTIPWKIFMALGVLVIVVGVGVFFIVKCVGNNNNSCRNTNSPTPSDYKQLPSSAPSIFPTFAPAFNDTASWQESLEQLFFSISGNDIYSPETPQGKATLWFEYNDTTITDYNTNDELVQRYALCVLFFALNSEPDGDIDECKWEGIQCRNHGTVFGIHRTGNALNGSIPSELRYLRNLTSLHLYNNSFTGQLPESLWSLTALTQLNFFNNSFTGQLPESLWLLTALTQLDLADNAFNGTISKSIMKLSNLQSLFLNGNNLIGSLPTEIGDYLNSLINFSVESNNLTGQIPENIWLLKSLVEMHFSQNSFRGTLSPFIWSRPNLTYLAASENALTGSIPAIPDNTTVSPLIKFHIYSNHLTGKLPDALSLLSDSLQEIVFFRNNFTGTIPSTFSQLTQLTYLDLSSNRLMGTIPMLADSVMKMYLTQNNLTGPLPASLPASSEEVWLSSNALTGTIPSNFGVGLANLTEVAINGTRLNGQIPRALCYQVNLTANLSHPLFIAADCISNNSNHVFCDCCKECY